MNKDMAGLDDDLMDDRIIQTRQEELKAEVCNNQTKVHRSPKKNGNGLEKIFNIIYYCVDGAMLLFSYSMMGYNNEAFPLVFSFGLVIWMGYRMLFFKRNQIVNCILGFFLLIMAVAFSHWVNLTRVLRAEVLQINTSEYVALSNKLGRSKLWIAKEHILPLVLSQIFVGTLLVFPHAIMHEASVTFLGFGLSPHEPAIGIILSESMSYLAMGAWWLAFFPGLALLIVVLLFDIIGDNLKRLLDPGEANN